MALNIYQQIAENIKISQKILITFPKYATGDHIASALALSLAMQKLNKDVTIISDGFLLPEKYKFLAQSNTIQDVLDNRKKFVIKINVSKTKVSDFSYDVKDNSLNIYITPEDGAYTADDVNIIATKGNFDLIFTIGTADLESLGKIYENNREFFFEVPVINIDCDSSNENFGQINMVELTATSCAELLVSLLEALNKKLIDQGVGTCLLCGIITATKGFRARNVTPKVLQIASTLVENEADRQEIIRNLYYNRGISTLQLWGNLLTKLKHDLNNKIIWTTISQQDFAQTNTAPHDIPDIFDELIVNIPETEISALLFEKNNEQIGAYVQSFNKHNLLDLFHDIKPEGTPKFITLNLENLSISEAESKIINKIKTLFPSTVQ